MRSWLCHGLLLALASSVTTAASASQTLVSSTAAAGARIGVSVSIGTDTLVVGAPDETHSSPQAGAAYVFTRAAGQWAECAKLVAPTPRPYGSFGEAVTTSRQFIVVGAPFDDAHGDASGAAYVYTKSGGIWKFQAELVRADPAPGQQFGAAVCMDGDTIVVGAYLDNAYGRNAGAAYVFTRSGNRWIQRAKLTASDPTRFAFFGASVAVKGSCILVGAPVAEAAYLFRLQSGAYVEQARLSAFGSHLASTYTAFGASVAIDQHALVVGAPLDTERGSNAGAAFVFQHSSSRITPHTKLLASTAAPDDEFGTSVTIDDFLIAAGAPYAGEHNEGAVTLFHSSQSRWKHHRTVGPAIDTAFFGAAVDLHDDELVTGAPAYGTSPGAAFVNDTRTP